MCCGKIVKDLAASRTSSNRLSVMFVTGVLQSTLISLSTDEHEPKKSGNRIKYPKEFLMKFMNVSAALQRASLCAQAL